MKSVLLTGASGFLGVHIYRDLINAFDVFTLSRKDSADLKSDLSISPPALDRYFDVVIHVAGLAHIYPKNTTEIESLNSINVKGTIHLLQSLEKFQPQTFIYISSVSVYGLYTGTDIDENTPLSGSSPYAISKIKAEELIQEWCSLRKIRYLILRLPLIVGKNSPGNLGKLERAIKKGRYIRLAQGRAKKSAVLANDVAKFISDYLHDPTLPTGIYNLTDGIHPSFFELEEAIRKYYGKSKILSIPIWAGMLLGKIGDMLSFFPLNSMTFKKITCTYTFSDEKARRELQWSPSPVLSFYDK